VATGRLDPQMRYRFRGRETLMGKMEQVMVFGADKSSRQIGVDRFGTLPIFDANAHHVYWSSEGQLLRTGAFKGTSQYMGDVLNHNTLFWVGSNFGFGMYRAGELGVAFTFDAENPGLNDNVKLPSIKGQLTDATALFASSLCWFFYTTQENGVALNHCVLIDDAGKVWGSTHTPQGDGTWLGHLRGKFPAGNFLFASTDDGLVRVELSNGSLEIARKYPDTEQFVDSGSRLYGDSAGIYVVGRNDVVRLQMR
jgi:hypothetical protein